MGVSPWKTVIVEAPTSTDLTRVETVKLELDIKTNEHDVLLLEWIRRASAEVVRYCGRSFAQARVTDYFAPSANFKVNQSIFLSLPPLSEVVSAVNGADAIDLTGYNVHPKSGRMDFLSLAGATPTWWGIGSSVAITYVGGYKVMDEVPRDLEDAVITLVKAKWFNRKRDPFVVSESVPGVGSTEYRFSALGEAGANLPPDVAAVLDTYKRYTI